uniref:DDE_Tnp_1_7 domain-containing protein n=1 Tax=Panagrellus redivivus TaxID=6233 RepID=A0A7E4VVY4_PANRE
MQAISGAVNIHAAKSNVTAFMKDITAKHSRTLYKTQRMVLQFLQSTVDKLYAGTSKTTTRKMCFLYNVKGVAKPLKLAPAKHLGPVNPTFEDGRKVRNIITAYF